MKKIITLIAFTVTTVLYAQKNEIPEAIPGQEYGAGVSENITFNVYTPDVAIEEIEKEGKKLENIVIQAEITGVCQKKGCWITLKNNKKETVFVKMKDYAFFLPISSMGKTVLLHGEMDKKVTSVEELKHYAKDAKKPKEEIEKITQPKIEYRFLASGIKVVK